MDGVLVKGCMLMYTSPPRRSGARGRWGGGRREEGGGNFSGIISGNLMLVNDL